MFDANRLLLDLIGGGLAGGGIGRKRYRYRPGRGMGDAIGRTVMSPQGLTILGGLAVAAYEHFKGAKAAGGPGAAGAPVAPQPSGGPPQATPPLTPPPFVPPSASGAPTPDFNAHPPAPAATPTLVGEERARLLIRAMVSAAQADGAIDPAERERILGRLAESGAGTEERAFLEQEMSQPTDIARLVAGVEDPVLAAEVYTASLLAIDPDTPAEQAYLATLAARLNLEPGMVRELESRLDLAAD